MLKLKVLGQFWVNDHLTPQKQAEFFSFKTQKTEIGNFR